MAACSAVPGMDPLIVSRPGGRLWRAERDPRPLLWIRDQAMWAPCAVFIGDDENGFRWRKQPQQEIGWQAQAW